VLVDLDAASLASTGVMDPDHDPVSRFDDLLDLDVIELPPFTPLAGECPEFVDPPVDLPVWQLHP
jgi:hypothetical protein